MQANIYPASPKGVPADFTQPTSAYKQQVVLVLLSMLLFMLLYLAMVAGSVYLIYWAVTYPVYTYNKFTILIKLGAIAMAGMLCAFLLKSLFKRHDTDSPLNIEITEAEHPRLFAFIRQLCQETGAPFPHKVYVNHEINACVFYNSTILSLFLPVKKNLLIGLGLVNSVNLSEFKAVVAHEFGHFAQSSMKLGSYVYMANSIIHSMVYERDKWDDLLEQWKSTDFRLSVFAWLLMPVVWLIRKSMNLIYQGINLVHASLSRQMEFNADRVAVSVSGSDAIVNALYKLGPASEAFDFSNGHLSTAADHKLYTRNLFYHHNKAVEHLSKHHAAFRDSLFQNKLKTQDKKGFMFSDEDEHLPQMYASHPSNYKREQNAKSQYIASDADERSPWLLFNEPEALAEAVSMNLLQINLRLSPNTSFHAPEEVQAFMDAELAETTYDERYKGVYNDRLLSQLELKQPEQLVEKSGLKAENLAEQYQELYGEPLSLKMKEQENRNKDIQTLVLQLQKVDKRKEFTLSDGKTYTSKDAKPKYEELIKIYEEDNAWFQQWDTAVFAFHYLLSAAQPDVQAKLLERYSFQMQWQPLFSHVLNLQQQLHEHIQQVMERGNLTEAEVRHYAGSFRSINNQLENTLEAADKLTIPQLNNLETISSVRKYLLDEPLTYIPTDSIDGQQINKLIEQMSMVIERMRRIHFKSLGSILSLQESIAEPAKVKALA